MNPRDNTPSNPVDQINAEDDPVLQAIEAIEARESDLEPKPIVAPVAPRPVVPVVAPVVKPIVVAPKPVITPTKPVIAPVKPPVAPIIPAKPIVVAAKPVPMTPSSRMAAELEKAPPMNTAKLILQFFGRHTPSKKPVIIIASIILVAALIAAGYFALHSL